MAATKNSDGLNKLLEYVDNVPPPEELTALREGAEAALSKPLFFVCGALKSGTTWLQLMLDAHPEIACRGEGHLVNFLLPGLGAALHKYNSKIRYKNKNIFNEIEGFPRFAAPHHYALLQSAVGLLLAQYDGENIRFIGEKSPDNVLYLAMLGRIFPHARFLHVIRDGAVSGWFIICGSRRNGPRVNLAASRNLPNITRRCGPNICAPGVNSALNTRNAIMKLDMRICCPAERPSSAASLNFSAPGSTRPK